METILKSERQPKGMNTLLLFFILALLYGCDEADMGQPPSNCNDSIYEAAQPIPATTTTTTISYTVIDAETGAPLTGIQVFENWTEIRCSASGTCFGKCIMNHRGNSNDVSGNTVNGDFTGGAFTWTSEDAKDRATCSIFLWDITDTYSRKKTSIKVSPGETHKGVTYKMLKNSSL